MRTWKHFKANFPGGGTSIANPSLVIQNSNLTACAVCFPGMGAKNKKDLQIFGNEVFRSIQQNCSSPSTPATEFLLDIPPVENVGESLNVKFLIKTRKNGPHLISTAHDEALQLQRSTSHILQSDLERYQKQMAPNKDPLQYSAK